jgi:hypothetical protein
MTKKFIGGLQGLTRHKSEKYQNWIFELIFSLSNIPTYTLSQTSRKKSKTLPFSIFFRSIISKLKFMEELFCQNSLDSVPNDYKNLPFSA